MDTYGLVLPYLDDLYESITPLSTIDETDITHNVYLARNKSTGKIAVKKYIVPSVFPIYKKLKELDNPHLCKIYACAANQHKGIVIEEYINGVTLREYMNEHGLFDKKETLALLKQLLDVLNVIHKENIVHRDINPENILISNDNVLKLIDFGIAREHNDQKQKDTTILGTLGYAAPEQFGFFQTDARTDLYAVGILTNELLTGKLPNEQLYQKKPFRKMIQKCTRIDARARFANANDVLVALGYPIANPDIWLPGFRTGVLWKKNMAVMGYVCMILYSIAVLFANAISPLAIILQIIALLLYIWLSTFLVFNIGYWDTKCPITRHMPKYARISVRLFLWLFMVEAGYILQNYIHYTMRGLPIPEEYQIK